MLYNVNHSSLEIMQNNRVYQDHLLIEKIAMFLFIISIGLGDVVSFGGIKLSYITTVVLLVLNFIANGCKLRITVSNYRYTSLLKIMYLWALYAIIQFVWAKNTDIYFASLKILLINVCVVYFIITYIKSDEDWQLVAYAFVTLSIITLMIGEWEIATGNHLLNNHYFDTYKEEKFKNIPFSVYGNENDNATVLVLGSIFCFLLFSIKKRKWYSFIFLLLFEFDSVRQVIITESRASFYSLIFFGVLFAAFLFDEIFAWMSKRSKFIFYFVLISITIIVIVFYFVSTSLDEVVLGISSEENYGSDFTRLKLIRKGIAGLLKTVGMGLGPGQSTVVCGMNLHFFYLEILVEYGVIIGGFVLSHFFRLTTRYNVFNGKIPNAIIRAFPIVLILLGVSSSGMIRIRPTWIVFSLIYSYSFNDFFFSNKSQNRILNNEME